MLFQGLLTIVLFALVIYFFVKYWPSITGSNDISAIDERIEELMKKKKELESLEKAYDVQKEINKCDKEIEKLNNRLKKLKK